MEPIKNVCIFGGTHGNELTGVYLVKKWKENPDLIKRPSFSTKTLTTNPRSVELNRRYVDVDLNRQFSDENFVAKIDDKTPHEVKRVQEIRAILSEGGEIGECDVIFDLHNTSANTKVCLIHKKFDPFVMHMIHYITKHFAAGMCYSLSSGHSTYHDSRRLGKYGIGLEVGPQPQGVLRADIFNMQEKTVHLGLDFLEKFNTGYEFPESKLDDYQVEVIVPYPRNADGSISAMVHSELQDQDWKPLSLEDPVFLTCSNKVLFLRDIIDISQFESGAIYPMFINEAAYYEKDIAFYLTKKIEIEIPKLKL